MLTEALLSHEHMLPEAEVNRHHRAMATTEAHIHALETVCVCGGGDGVVVEVVVPLQPSSQ